MPRYLLTGAPGTGKTAVISLLSLTYATVPEPARQVIVEHARDTGERTLDHRPDLFVDRLVARCVRDYLSAADEATTFFDRGLPDCAAYAEIFGLDRQPVLDVAASHPYESRVFLMTPWAEIYTTDELRRATFEQVEVFHASLVDVYGRLGYELIQVPRGSPEARAAFIREMIGQPAGG